jgi:hypothetical protein
MLLELLSANYVEVRHTPSSAVAMGTLTALNDTYGFPLADVAADEEGSFIIEAEKVRGPKGTDITTDVGEAAYWDNTGDDDISNVATDSILIGTMFEANVQAATTQIITFDGKAAFLKA